MMFLLPSSPLNIKKVDPEFEHEYNVLKHLDFKICLYDHDQFVTHGQLISDIDFAENGKIVLRTWMLKSSQYTELFNLLNRNGLKLLNTPEQYLNCHHYPNVYHIIKEWAPNSIWFQDITENVVDLCRNHINSDIIIKDFVKSEKLLQDVFLLPTTLDKQEFFEKVIKFKNCRGKLFSEGIVFKQHLKLKDYGGKTNEFRLFVLNGKIITSSQHTGLSFGEQPNLDFISEIISKIDSNFYTIDIAELEDGQWVILETGDGQVSGLSSNQDQFIFYSKFLNIFQTKD